MRIRQNALYWRDVGTLDAYYESQHGSRQRFAVFNLYDNHWPLRTWQHQYPPAKFVFADPERMGVALDSIVAGGSVISGGRVQTSVIGNNVRVNSYCESLRIHHLQPREYRPPLTHSTRHHRPPR